MMMADLPMMPFYPDAYMGDTQHLSIDEHGAYLLLLMISWMNGEPLDDDDLKLRRTLSITKGRWMKLRPIIIDGKLFKSAGGKIIQKKLEKTREKSSKLVKQRSDAGKRSAAVRALKTNKSGSTSVPTPVQRPFNDRSDLVATPITITKEEDSNSRTMPTNSDDKLSQRNLYKKILDLTGLDNRTTPMSMSLARVWMDRYTDKQILDGIRSYTEKTSYDWGKVNSLKYFEGGIQEQADTDTDKSAAVDRELLLNMNPIAWSNAKARYDTNGSWDAALGPKPDEPGYKGPD
jgi:uncharacterized protein YdaU (DUF1376 family)